MRGALARAVAVEIRRHGPTEAWQGGLGEGDKYPDLPSPSSHPPVSWLYLSYLTTTRAMRAWLMQPVGVDVLEPRKRAESNGEGKVENNSTVASYECGQPGIKSAQSSNEANSMI